jgi:amidohydrolase
MVRGEEERLPGKESGEGRVDPESASVVRRAGPTDVSFCDGMDIEQAKSLAIGEIDARGPELRQIALKIHDSPEVGFQENKAAGWLTEYLSGRGFAVEKGICNMPTAFEAKRGSGRPAVAFLAEYDALPEMGHACGHNLIAAASLGAALGAVKAAEALGGTILVIGTPAEEVWGGKALMANRGWFRDLDAAMLVHPDNTDAATAHALACQALDVEFTGRAAHAAAQPEAGVNALEAMLISFNAINSLRQHIKGSARIHGIITDGGQAVNVVPAHSAGSFLVRAADDAYLDELKERVVKCFAAGAEATGATLKYKWDEARYATMKNNMTMAKLYQLNMHRFNRSPLIIERSEASGSTDMGNVSHLAPTIQPYVSISAGALIHSPEFAAAARSEAGIQGMLDAAKGMALTAVDLLADPATMSKVRREFEQGAEQR